MRVRDEFFPFIFFFSLRFNIENRSSATLENSSLLHLVARLEARRSDLSRQKCEWKLSSLAGNNLLRLFPHLDRNLLTVTQLSVWI